MATRALIIVPAFNEQAALPALLEELHAVRRDGANIDVLVVDDGSADATSEVARRGGARVTTLCRNLGIGGAVQCGIRLALREGFDCAIQVDGDGQHPPTELRKLIGAFESEARPDLVIGSRYIGEGEFRSTALRRLGAWWLRVILRILGIRVTDPTSGFRLYGRRALALFERTYPYDYPEPESLAVARATDLRIAEVPVVMRERQGGHSSIAGLKAPYYMFKVTLAVLLSFVRVRRAAR
jgi:glycosyltransferase involved in cell wall biosynthesis